jgi:hypothetical protein
MLWRPFDCTRLNSYRVTEVKQCGSSYSSSRLYWTLSDRSWSCIHDLEVKAPYFLDLQNNRRVSAKDLRCGRFTPVEGGRNRRSKGDRLGTGVRWPIP